MIVICSPSKHFWNLCCLELCVSLINCINAKEIGCLGPYSVMVTSDIPKYSIRPPPGLL